MGSLNKAKAAGVSASSFLDLKAELSKHESDLAKKKASGRTYEVGGVQRTDKKPTVWARTNKGVHERNARDLVEEAVSKRTAESMRAALERKAKIYDKLKKGKTGGLTDAQYDALLVDFDSKAPDEHDHYSSSSEDVDESLTVPKAPNDLEDPIIEYEDEFGRMRTGRRSEVPRHLVPPPKVEEEEIDPFVIHNPTNYFPVYEPSAERVAEIQAAASEAENPLATHYDANKEVRAKGAAFYSFSADEEARAREMEELRRAREETELARREAGAVDVKPGDIEGMVEGGDVEGEVVGKTKGKDVVLAARSRAMEKRKREIEERRKLVEAKRRKVKGDATKTEGQDAGSIASMQASSKVAGPFAIVAAKSQAKSQRIVGSMEAKEKGKSRWDQHDVRRTESGSKTNAADDFLAQLEKDLVKKT